MKILYLGQGKEGSTSHMKGQALRRLGHEVTLVDQMDHLPPSRLVRALSHRSGHLLCAAVVRRNLRRACRDWRGEVVWVDSGMFASRGLLGDLRRQARWLVNYNHDDPTGRRDGNAWYSFKRSVPAYDRLVTVREETERELLELGAKSVARVWRSYDEVVHCPQTMAAAERESLASEVVFVGSWMPERGPFLAQIVRSGAKLTIIGDHWQHCSQPEVRACVKRTALYGFEYTKVIQCAKIALGLLSKGNRDLHTTRSAEVPAIGTLFCAERTREHLAMYREGEEAVFWSTAEECAASCVRLLADPAGLARIAAAGQARARASGYGHEAILGGVLRDLAGKA